MANKIDAVAFIVMEYRVRAVRLSAAGKASDLGSARKCVIESLYKCICGKSVGIGQDHEVRIVIRRYA